MSAPELPPSTQEEEERNYWQRFGAYLEEVERKRIVKQWFIDLTHDIRIPDYQYESFIATNLHSHCRVAPETKQQETRIVIVGPAQTVGRVVDASET